MPRVMGERVGLDGRDVCVGDMCEMLRVMGGVEGRMSWDNVRDMCGGERWCVELADDVCLSMGMMRIPVHTHIHVRWDEMRRDVAGLGRYVMGSFLFERWHGVAREHADAAVTVFRCHDLSISIHI